MSFENLIILSGAVRRAVHRARWLLPVPLLLGVVVLLLLRPTGPAYEARATIVATRTALPVEQLVSTAVELFRAGAVDEAVPEGSAPRADIGVQAVTGAPVFYVLGRGSTPDDAADLANRAAEQFLLEAEQLSELGRFAIFVEADPADAVRVGAALAVIGAVAVAVGGLVALITMSVALEGPFRPVRSTSRLEWAIGKPVGLIWFDGSRVTIDPAFRKVLATESGAEWIVRPLADVRPPVIDEILRQLDAAGRDAERCDGHGDASGGAGPSRSAPTEEERPRSTWARLALVPVEMPLGAVLLDHRLRAAHNGSNWTIGLLAADDTSPQ